MFIQLATILYLIVAVAMVALILMQRGAGAAAGSGFGAGASATVFGARGASNFLSKATKWLAIVFFALSLAMAMYATRSVRGPAAEDLGVMGRVPAAATPAEVPAAPAVGPAQAEVPAAPVEEEPSEDDTQD
ncbi:MAG: preprotein translocase subunit SecG [Rehaibacterium terrae]